MREPKIGDVVAVLEWYVPACAARKPVPYTACVISYDPKDCTIATPYDGTPGKVDWARLWRSPTPRELDAHRLSQLVGGGL